MWKRTVVNNLQYSVSYVLSHNSKCTLQHHLMKTCHYNSPPIIFIQADSTSQYAETDKSCHWSWSMTTSSKSCCIWPSLMDNGDQTSQWANWMQADLGTCREAFKKIQTLNDLGPNKPLELRAPHYFKFQRLHLNLRMYWKQTLRGGTTTNSGYLVALNLSPTWSRSDPVLNTSKSFTVLRWNQRDTL